MTGGFVFCAQRVAGCLAGTPALMCWNVLRFGRYTSGMRLWWFAILPAILLAQGTAPKDKPTDYPAHRSSEKIEIGGEYLLHSIPADKGMIFAQDYLVVEVALYSTSKQPLLIKNGQFTLRINGRKTVLYPEPPSMVVVSLKYPDTDSPAARNVQVEGGAGPGTVILGRPQQVERFPGDRRPQEGRPPQQPQVKVDDPERPTLETRLKKAALPEGDVRLPVSGVLYFKYDGKLKAIKTLELVYDAPGGAIALPLL